MFLVKTEQTAMTPDRELLRELVHPHSAEAVCARVDCYAAPLYCAAGGAMLAQARHPLTPPPALPASHVVSNAVAGGHTGAALAKAVVTGMAVQRAMTASLLAMALLLVIAGGWMGFHLISNRAGGT